MKALNGHYIYLWVGMGSGKQSTQELPCAGCLASCNLLVYPCVEGQAIESPEVIMMGSMLIIRVNK